MLSKENTPNLLRIADDGVFYLNAYSLGSITQLSMPYLLSGMKNFDVKQNIQTKIKTFGYKSKLLTTNFDPVYESFRYGFDESDYQPSLKTPIANRVKRKLGWYIDEHFPSSLRRSIHRIYTKVFGKPIGYLPADEMFELAYNLINGDVFLWIHLMDSHIPYSPKPSISISRKEIEEANTNLLNAVWLKGSLTFDEIKFIKKLYRLNVMEMDAAIGTFYDHVKDDCVFILTSDHGDEHGEEENNFGHKAHRVNDVLRHIPLIISGHGKHGVKTDRLEMDLLPRIILKLAEDAAKKEEL